MWVVGYSGGGGWGAARGGNGGSNGAKGRDGSLLNGDGGTGLGFQIAKIPLTNFALRYVSFYELVKTSTHFGT